MRLRLVYRVPEGAKDEDEDAGSFIPAPGLADAWGPGEGDRIEGSLLKRDSTGASGMIGTSSSFESASGVAEEEKVVARG